MLDEADESELWIEVLIECELAPDILPVRPLLKEAGELRAIFFQSIRTARENQSGGKL